MGVMEIGSALVKLCNEGRGEEAVREFYSPNIVSIEGQGSDEVPARIEGLDGVMKKGEWWEANNEVHAMTARGPFIGHRDDQFAVFFELDLTPKGGERGQMTEVGLYTVADGKIAQEEFLYLMG